MIRTKTADCRFIPALLLAVSLFVAASDAQDIVPTYYAQYGGGAYTPTLNGAIGLTGYYDRCDAGACGCGPTGCGSTMSCADCGTCECCGDCGSSCCQPYWTIRANAIFMERRTPESLTLMQNTEPTAPFRQLNAQDFDFDYQGGYDIALIAQPQSGWGSEIRFMGVQDTAAAVSATVLTDMANPLQINTVQPTFVQDVATVDATYDSSFQSIELNLRKQCCNVAVLIGFRYLELDEEAIYRLTGSAPAATYYTNTQNRMYGFQGGLEGTLFGCGNFHVDGFARGGVYYNAANHRSFLINGVITQPALGDEDTIAVSGELGIVGLYDISPSISLRFGYQALFFERVALADNQIPVSDLFNQTGIDVDNGTFFHGGVFGIEFRR